MLCRASPLSTIYVSPRALRLKFWLSFCNTWYLRACSLQHVDPWKPGGLRRQQSKSGVNLYLILKVSIHSNHGNWSHSSPHFPISEQVGQSLKFSNQVSPLPVMGYIPGTATIRLCCYVLDLSLFSDELPWVWEYFSPQSQEKLSFYIAVWKSKGINTTLSLDQASTHEGDVLVTQLCLTSRSHAL